MKNHGCTPTIWLPILVSLAISGRSSPAPLTQPTQPLIENSRHVGQAMRFLGSPLDPKTDSSLFEAQSEEDALKIQEALDSSVLLEVHINPEERVKLTRGAAQPLLQQSGYTPFLIKVVNLSTSTRRLNITSPQAGQVYGGMTDLSARRMQRIEHQETKDPTGDTNRFLDLEIYDNPPMSDRLSGYEVEYFILLIHASRSGTLSATLAADTGQGTQDLGFRSQCSVLFQSRPAVEVRLNILDQDGAPTTARLVFKDESGRVFPPQPKRLAPDFYFQEQVYRRHGQTILLPPGKLTMQSSRGPEYQVQTQPIEIPKEPATSLDIRLKRWIDPSAFGFYSGDHHIHGAGCAHYTHPSEGVRPGDMFLQIQGEGLNVGCVLTWGPCFDYQRQFFRPTVDLLSEPFTIMKYDLEISGFGSEALGHVCLLNLADQDYPGSNGSKHSGWPTWTTPVLRWAKQQGGVTGYAHSASGLQIDPVSESKRLMRELDGDADGWIDLREAKSGFLPKAFEELDLDHDGGVTESELMESIDAEADQLPNRVIPEMNGVGAMEICVSAVEGVCDFISSMDTARIQEWNMWYHLLNSGFNMKVSGETDFPCMSGSRVGQGRVYVQLGQVDRVDFKNWCEALAAGKSYVSDGFAHALKFTVEGKAPGFGDVELPTAGRVRVQAAVAFSSDTPESVAQGLILPPGGKRFSGDTVTFHGPPPKDRVTGGTRTVELIVNGQVAAEEQLPADGQSHHLEWTVELARSSWIAVRQFPQLHTNPVNVIIDGKPIRASGQSALWCRETIRKLWDNRHTRISPGEREDAWKSYERAMNEFTQRALQAEP